jgi:HK97 family phage major capsid protein
VSSTIERLQAEQRSQEAFISELLDQVEAEQRDLVEAEVRNVQAAEARIKEIADQLEPLVAFEKRKAATASLEAFVPQQRQEPARVPVEHRSLGEIFVDSPEFRGYAGRGASVPVTVPEFRAVGPDPLLTTTTPGSVLVPNAPKYVGPTHFPQYPLLDLVGSLTVSGNSVTYVTIGDSSGADVVAEGAAKPPVAWTASEQTYTLETVAGWFKASRQALADIPALRELIDQKIRRAIDTKLNTLCVSAINGAFTGANSTTGVKGQSIDELVRIAMGKLQTVGVSPTAVLLNPADHAAFDIKLLGKPLGAASVHGGMWGLPIIAANDVAAGTAIIGDLSNGITYFQRTGMELYATDSDVSDAGAGAVKSDFRANLLTFLGEVRGKFVATDPSVLHKVVYTP